jgi:hypothetical protein
VNTPAKPKIPGAMPLAPGNSNASSAFALIARLPLISASHWKLANRLPRRGINKGN